MQVLVKDLKPGQHVQGSNLDLLYRVENVVKTDSGVSVRMSLHGKLTEFTEYNPYDSFVAVTLH